MLVLSLWLSRQTVADAQGDISGDPSALADRLPDKILNSWGAAGRRAT